MCSHGPLAKYVKLLVYPCAANPGMFSPPTQVSDPDMHHGTCVMRVPWCMSGLPTSSFLWNQWREKRSRHSRCMRNPQFCVSGSRPIGWKACDCVVSGRNDKDKHNLIWCSFPGCSLVIINWYNFDIERSWFNILLYNYWKWCIFNYVLMFPEVFLISCASISSFFTEKRFQWALCYVGITGGHIHYDRNSACPLFSVRR